MFYQEEMDNVLRFGDVLKGFVLAAPNVKDPHSYESYDININLPKYCVVLSPCCSIGQKVISLSPLIKLLPPFFDNPYLVEDLTRINRKMEPQQAVTPYIWDKLSSEEKQRRLGEGHAYAFLYAFVYEKYNLFPKYKFHRRQENIETNYYMIDFKNIYKINCDKIISAKKAPLDVKHLQLSVQTRSELREKLSYYYWRPPKEDKILLED